MVGRYVSCRVRQLGLKNYLFVDLEVYEEEIKDMNSTE